MDRRATSIKSKTAKVKAKRNSKLMKYRLAPRTVIDIKQLSELRGKR